MINREGKKHVSFVIEKVIKGSFGFGGSDSNTVFIPFNAALCSVFKAESIEHFSAEFTDSFKFIVSCGKNYFSVFLNAVFFFGGFKNAAFKNP